MQAAFRFREFIGQRRGNTVARHIQRSAVELIGVTDNKGDGHGFTQRAAQAEHDAANHPVFGERQHDAPNHLPRGAADPICGLFHHHRRLLEDVTHYGGDIRNDHDGQNDAGRQDADTERRAGKQRADKRDRRKDVADWFLEVSRKQRGENKQAPHAVHDTRDCRQQLNSDTQRAF